MNLGDKQRLFTLNLALLTIYSYEHGYELTVGDAYRDKRAHGAMGTQGVYGHRKSAHKQRLAQDYNLFKDSVYLTESSDYKELGEYWKSLHPLNMWGGDFKHPDGNHFSMQHNGVM